MRVKKEEELQETPGPGGGLNCPIRSTSTPLNNNSINSNNNNGPSLLEQRSASTPSKKELIAFNATAYVLGRRPSPPPEDWKPVDKCYFCLDGKLPNDEQPPLVSLSCRFLSIFKNFSFEISGKNLYFNLDKGDPETKYCIEKEVRKYCTKKLGRKYLPTEHLT